MRAVLGASSTLEDDSHQRRAEVASQVSSRDDSAGPVTPSPTSPLPGTMATVSSPATVADNKGTSTPMNVDVVYPAYGSESESAPQLPPGLAADAEIGSHDLTRHSSAELTEELFRATWSRGEPLVVTDVLGKMQHSWGPEAFIERYGKDACYISHCKDNRLIKLVTVDTFFGTFGQSEEVKKEELGNGIWKLKVRA